MLTIRELRSMHATLSLEQFVQQLGPFVLVRKPPDAIEAQAALELAAKGTLLMTKRRTVDGVSLLFEFEDLEIATLPPVGREETLSVGRLPDNDVVIDHTSVSKRHAEVRWKDGRCLVVDLGSTNGTLVNDARIAARAELRDSDIVTFGDVRFVFLLTPSLYRFMRAPASTRRPSGNEPIVSAAPSSLRSSGPAARPSSQAQLTPVSASHAALSASSPALPTASRPAQPPAAPATPISRSQLPAAPQKFTVSPGLSITPAPPLAPAQIVPKYQPETAIVPGPSPASGANAAPSIAPIPSSSPGGLPASFAPTPKPPAPTTPVPSAPAVAADTRPRATGPEPEPERASAAAFAPTYRRTALPRELPAGEDAPKLDPADDEASDLKATQALSPVRRARKTRAKPASIQPPAPAAPPELPAELPAEPLTEMGTQVFNPYLSEGSDDEQRTRTQAFALDSLELEPELAREPAAEPGPRLNRKKAATPQTGPGASRTKPRGRKKDR